ncbi:hypothetical protein EDC02_7701 [Micromonospora sp. Llam0]|uniref:hypothetical protein n=1 Tax=Micromonospora sp. Llam0 TaxID=2485143 RepID=UPI000F4A3705|nr:hypothetical protein [Micromonospora sp. Llam0]ROO52760.1 hypothetical protein EDC02_7701 [Micromonospora sp. Llam0]
MIPLFASQSAVTRPADLRLGQAVHVNARAAWLPAIVTSVTHTRVGVAYGAPLQAGGQLADAVAPWVVRPADGVRLHPVHEVRVGDDVVAFDGTTLTVAGAWQGRDRWWVIDYTTGGRAIVPPGAILRLADPTPQVTVNGVPL